MRKLFKKSLACVLAVALCLTAMVGVLSVSADVVGTLTMVGFNGVVGDTATVTATFAAPEGELISESFIDVAVSNGAKVESVALAGANDDNGIELNDAKTRFNIRSANGLATAVVTITLADATAAGTYTVTLTDVTSATDSQSLIKFATTSADAVIAAPHVHNFVPTVTKEATCEEDGVKTFACECGKDTYTEAIPAIGHKWDEGVVTTAPDCDDAGVRTYTCLNDDTHTKTEAIDALGHTPGEPAEENRVEAKPGVAGSYDMVVRCTVCNAELSKTTHEIPALPVAPFEDATVTATVTINISETINTRILFSKQISEYADFDLVVTRQKAYLNDGVYDLTDAQDFVYSKEEAYSILDDGRAMYLYNELGMYELGIDMTVMARMYDANGNYVAHSVPVTTNVGKLAYDLYKPANAAAKNKNIAIDIAKLGDEAQKYMVNGKTCGLATVTSPISYFPEGATEGATFDASKLDTTNIPNSKVTGVTVTPTVNLSANPALRYLINGTGTKYAHEDLKLVIDYINGKNGSDCGVTLTKDDLSIVGTAGTDTVRYLNVFAGIALYDGNVPVTATLYAGETELASVTYSVEAYVADYYTNARMGAVLKAVANLGTSARGYFGMN